MILGITGLAGAGKDTIGDYLVTNYGFTRYGFADKLKELAEQADPMIGDDSLAELIYRDGWDIAKKENTEVRTFLQNLGHGARQVFGDTFWIDRVFDQDLPLRTVITDVRYENEFYAIRRNGGYIIRVNRDVELVNNHITEVGHLDFDVDFTIDNNGSKRDLYDKIIDLMYKKFGMQ